DSIRLEWDACASPGFDHYLIYASRNEGFVPGAADNLSAPVVTMNTYTYLPEAGCWYYRVAGINSSGYSGGFSAQSGACSGPDAIDPDVTVVSPDGGEFFEPADTTYIRWIATDNEQVDSVSIWFSLNNGADFQLLAGGEPNDSIYMWIVPAVESDSCLIRIVAWDAAMNEGHDTSDEVFTVKDLTDVEDGEDDPEIPVFTDRLEQNYPNPFNGNTTIAYSLSGASFVELVIYDTAGRRLRTLERRDRGPGRHLAVWNGKDDSGSPVTSGVYFCRIKAGKFSQTRKIVYMR
ncbi:MAG TPA: T9SS type A sorting domain-containing protein, partial [Candidatus Krumholzibacterium sp.]|nr:T9SS type A sorting domain-containing protein [Candidatus Krumholzibacterium sp.]